jgi:hypothetical protein
MERGTDLVGVNHQSEEHLHRDNNQSGLEYNGFLPPDLAMAMVQAYGQGVW